MDKKKKKAVILKYPKGAEAPIVLGKGSGKIAEFIIEQAQENEVRIEENKELVNILSDVETGSYVPEEAWETLAIIFSFILEERECNE